MAAMGVAAIVTATTASAAVVSTLQLSASPAYCAGTSYTITLAAADATALMAQASGYQDITFQWAPYPQGTNVEISTLPYVAGQGMTVKWTPTYLGATTLVAYAYDPTRGPNAIIDDMLPNINVVQSAPAGSSCTPAAPSGGTGSASSIPVIGPLLSSLLG
ncbi:MAG: hypothetical protein JWN03_6756 [Nocardia sp.]|uniref:hypothetical protein n=1 Tax=Nocardia sp. TaxID=1821 RepID=UPI0026398C6C|nr:hypothetical protein [Nocardia sp.]MCU1646481.1 hypothetical protein [Nocardia sp.]